MQINRIYHLDKLIDPQRVLVIYGPRRVGKTTLIKQYLAQTKYRYLFEVGDSLPFQKLMTSLDPQIYQDHFQEYQLLVIDEAQYIPQIGRALKLLVDTMPHLNIIATGSSSFELSGQVGEPLTGRKWELMFYPVSYLELKQQFTTHELSAMLSTHLIYGLYPEVLTIPSLKKKQAILEELTASYLLKDILALEKLKSSQILVSLLKLLALQLGNEVSLQELGGQLGIDYKTVARYIDLLQKTFIIFELSGYSRNLRSEVVKKKKYYFLDLGVRNALINQFQSLDDRADLGHLWENFIIIERLKKLVYTKQSSLLYFWRTWDQQEIDLIEDINGQLTAYKIKLSPTKPAKLPPLFAKTYPEAQFQVINKKNYLKFIS